MRGLRSRRDGSTDGPHADLRTRIAEIWSEIRRRKVFRAASIYLVAVWTVSLGAAELFPAFGLPDWSVRLVVILGIVGFPLVVAGAWVFEITSQGVVLDRVARANRGRGDTTRLVSSGTTTWAQTRRIAASWRDGSGERSADYSRAFILGRDPVADLRIDDPRISRLHARVTYERGMWWIEDLSSRNGTNVNGVLITEKTPLGDDAEIRLYEGATPIRLRVRHHPVLPETSDGVEPALVDSDRIEPVEAGAPSRE